MRSLAAFCSLLLAGCASTEVTVLFGPRAAEGDTEPGAMLMISQRFGERGLCSYVHLSDPTNGRPFNDRPEVSDDLLPGCGWTWRGESAR